MIAKSKLFLQWDDVLDRIFVFVFWALTATYAALIWWWFTSHQIPHNGQWVDTPVHGKIVLMVCVAPFLSATSLLAFCFATQAWALSKILKDT